MTTDGYADALDSLAALDGQLAQALADAQQEAAALARTDDLQQHDEARALQRDSIMAALNRSKAALQAMGLTSLPTPGTAEPQSAEPPATLQEAGQALRDLSQRILADSRDQAGAAEEHARLQAAIRRARSVELAEAQDQERQAQERAAAEERERERLRAVDRLSERIAGLQAERDHQQQRLWTPGKRARLQDLDARIATLFDEREQL